MLDQDLENFFTRKSPKPCFWLQSQQSICFAPWTLVWLPFLRRAVHNEQLVLGWVPRVEESGREMGSPAFLWESHTERKPV